MDYSTYWIGILFALLAGQAHYTGLIIDKMIINKLPSEAKVMKNLVRNPKWLLAVSIRYLIGSITFIMAQLFIGPAIIPGLMASGLITLTIGSIIINKERLKNIEILAILLIIVAIVLIGLSELSIQITETDLLESDLILRLVLSTVIIFVIALSFQFVQKKIEKYRGVLLALLSGLMFSLNNYWVSPLIWFITHLFSGSFILSEFLLFLVSSVILIAVNIFGITKMAEAFKYGQAGNLVPIQSIPVQLTPTILYFLVFLLIPPSIYSIIYFLIAVVLIIACSFILGKRQAQIEIIE